MEATPPDSTVGSRSSLIAGFSLALLVVLVYWGSGTHAFVDFDDGEYVYANPNLKAGLTLAGFRWAFTTFYAANWHPLTWLSHMLDVTLFGLDPGPHHRVNVVLHALNTVLLFGVFRRMTGAVWRSALVAALFGAHPLHVESVAWVAERKDLLCAFFLLLAIAAYVGFVRKPAPWRYACALFLFALGLLSKSMIVTLPFLLLLLDFWPLRRASPLEAGTNVGRRHLRSPLMPLLAEKIPFVLLAAAASAATYLAQARAKATAVAAAFPWSQRIANALVSDVLYLKRTLWPAGLAVFYPHPATLGERVPAADWISSGVLLVVLTALALRQLRRRPYVAFGWFWFLGALVPVAGFIQVGSQALADRYTYIPLIGIFVTISWGGAELMARARAPGPVPAAISAAGLLAFSIAAHRQNGYWVDGVRLYSHAIEVTKKNWLAWNNLGMQYLDSDPRRAESCFRRAVELRADYGQGWYNLGVASGRQGRHSEAIACYEKALELDPSNADGWVNLSLEHQDRGDLLAAIRASEAALKIRPDDVTALSSLVYSYWRLGEPAREKEFFARLSRADPAVARGLAERMRAALR